MGHVIDFPLQSKSQSALWQRVQRAYHARQIQDTPETTERLRAALNDWDPAFRTLCNSGKGTHCNA